MKRVAPNLYERNGYFYYRFMVDGKPKTIAIGTKSRRKANEFIEQRRKDRTEARLPGRRKKAAFQRIAQVLEFYREAGCPTRSGAKREGKQLRDETRSLDSLDRHLGKLNLHEFDASDWADYTDKRRPEFEKGSGERTLDLEWVTLSSAFRFAARSPRDTGLKSELTIPKPVPQRRSADVKHCREFQPEHAEELHSIAEDFFMGHKSEVFGWYVLLAAMIGQRVSEMLRLEASAQHPNTPGFNDGKHLHLYRSTTHKGTASFIEIGPELRACLDAHKHWLELRHPSSRWFFPSPRTEGAPIGVDSITHAMARATRRLRLPKRTTHGLRSYFVNVLRSRGMSDPDIARKIGHKSEGSIIVETYGEYRPIKLDWTPNHAPAWERFSPTGVKVVEAAFG